VLGRDDLRRRAAAPAGHEIQAVGFHVDVGAAGVVGGAQDSQPFGLRTFKSAALALRPAGQDERDWGLRHQLGDVEAAHQVEADLGQADPGGQAVELAQAAVGVLGGERGGHAVNRRRPGQLGQLSEHLERDGVGVAAVGVDGKHRDVLVR
jgi:hypothetical protein